MSDEKAMGSKEPAALRKCGYCGEALPTEAANSTFARCTVCSRWAFSYRDPFNGRRTATLVLHLMMFAGIGLFGVVLLASIWVNYMVFVGSGMLVGLALISGAAIHDGYLSCKTGVDRIKNIISRGAEARVTGYIKIAIGLAAFGLCVFGLVRLPGWEETFWK